MSTIEQAIQEAGAIVAPRVTPVDIEANIVSEHYLNVGDCALGDTRDPGPFGEPGRAASPMDLLTLCVLVLSNGFTVTGESACASPENFDAEIGRKIARQNAVQKVWPLMGYELRSKLASRARYGVGTGAEPDAAVEQPARARSLLPQYRSHKVLEASKIIHIESAPADQERRHAGGDWLVYLDQVEQPICVGHDDYYVKHRPTVGGYYVRYEDGYQSFSPAAPFESGYTRI